MFKNDLKYLGFNDLWFMIIGIIVLGFLIPQIFFGVKIGDPNYPYQWEWLEATMYTTCYWSLNRFIMIKFRKKYPSFELVKKRLIYGLGTGVIAVLVSGALLSPIINMILELIGLPNTNQPKLLQGFGASISATFFIIAIYESIWYYSQLKKSIQEQERVKVAHVQSQLDGLRNQVNPHFLFNSLNTLNHIVEYENKTVAKGFINQLSKVYRYILDSREESTIILEEELNFVKAYISIQKERFLESLQVNIDVPQQYIYKKIIPLSLQLLIENAIKHNIISTKKPLTITIDIDEQNHLIRVTNNLQKKSKVLHSTKVGLENIIERYRLLSDHKSVKIETTENYFTVSIPLL
ncbi:MAG: sensor histidine kinase [Saprospiraceae bacterium]